jgi:beta-glucanase (GH16 family)
MGASSLPIWSEEFDYSGPPDPEIWSYDIGQGSNGWGNAELQTYTSENAIVEDGTLRIMGQRSTHWEHSFTSARIKTLDKVTVKYGRIEGSIQFPDLANGLWPAFWMLGNDFPQVGWPKCGEIDIMEMGKAEAIANGTVNRVVGSTAHWDMSGSYANYGLYRETPTNLNAGFHNFTLDWTPSALTSYVDGEWIWTMDITPSACDGCEEFHNPYFIVLNLAIGGHYPGITNHRGITAPFPAEYLIDYIRIYANEWTEMGGTYFPASNPTKVVDCGCGSNCTSEALDQIVTDDELGSFTCRDRINELMETKGLEEQEACFRVSSVFNEACSRGCDPATCSPPTSASMDGIDCGCGNNCNSSVLDEVATDSSGSYSCRDRIQWLMTMTLKSEQESCAQVATEFPSVCSQGCNPSFCNRPATATVTNCGCQQQCDDSALSQLATDEDGSFTCRSRISTIMDTVGVVEETACKLVSHQFPSICGLHCDPTSCKSGSNVTDCGCQSSCDGSILDQEVVDNSGSGTCRQRINLVMATTGLSQDHACSLVAGEFPDTCGQGCNPPLCSSNTDGSMAKMGTDAPSSSTFRLDSDLSIASVNEAPSISSQAVALYWTLIPLVSMVIGLCS